MSNEETARAAADGMHGKMIEGRAIVARLRSGGRNLQQRLQQRSWPTHFVLSTLAPCFCTGYSLAIQLHNINLKTSD